VPSQRVFFFKKFFDSLFQLAYKQNRTNKIIAEKYVKSQKAI